MHHKCCRFILHHACHPLCTWLSRRNHSLHKDDFVYLQPLCTGDYFSSWIRCRRKRFCGAKKLIIEDQCRVVQRHDQLAQNTHRISARYLESFFCFLLLSFRMRNKWIVGDEIAENSFILLFLVLWSPRTTEAPFQFKAIATQGVARS